MRIRFELQRPSSPLPVPRHLALARTCAALLLAGGLVTSSGACSSSDGDSAPGDGPGSGGTGGTLGVGGDLGAPPGPGPGPGGANGGPWSLPDDFTAGLFGGYQLGPAIDDDGTSTPTLPDDAPGADGEGCGTTIIGIVRDFKDEHDDFESFCCDVEEGIVENQLGDDKKPVYAHSGGTDATSGPEAFDQWYRTVEDVNLPHWLYLNLEPNDGVYTFHSDSFFPLDGEGWGNQDRAHNYHFTTEIHTKFRYEGGEVFRFTGDDDVFVYINGHLVIDIGGVHGATSAEVVLDDVASDIDITIGEEYDLDLFQAERRTSESNFRIDTTLELVDCGYVPPVVVR